MSKSSIEPPSEAADDVHPLRREVGSPNSWTYLACYFLIGIGSLFVLIEAIRTGFWLKLGVPCFAIWLGLTGLAATRRKEQPHLTNRST